MSSKCMFESREVCNVIEDLLFKCGPQLDTGLFQWSQLEPVFDAVQTLIQKQADFSPPPEVAPLFSSKERQVDQFKRWLHDFDASCSPVDIADLGEEGFGLVALRDISQEETVLTIPRCVIMATETADASVLAEIFAANRKLFAEVPSLKLCMFLLLEAFNEKSFYRPYIEMMPRSFDMPLYFSKPALELMKVSAAGESTFRLFRTLVRQYATIFKMLQSRKHLSFAQYFTWQVWRWAVCCVMSRQNKIPTSDGKGEEIVLIPMWDLANHESGQVTTFFSDPLNSVISLAMKDIKKGEPFNIFYGKRSNCNFVVYQGFVPDGNKDDQVEMRLGLSSSDPLQRTKAQILYEMGIAPVSRYVVRMDREVPVSPDFLTFVRVFCLDKNELGMALVKRTEVVNKKHFSHAVGALSATHEAKVWKFVSVRCTLLVTQIDNAIGEKESKATNGGIDRHQKLIVKLLKTEKVVYEKLQKFASGMLAAVQSNPHSFLLLY